MAPQDQRSALALEIADAVKRYLDGHLSYGEVRAWLRRNWWRPYPTSDGDAANLMQAVELRLDEYAAGYWTEAGLKQALQVLLNH